MTAMEDFPHEGAPVRGGEYAEPARQDAAETSSEQGWVTTEVAAAALGVSPRTVRDYIRSGKLDATPQGEGVTKTWLVSIYSVQELRQSRRNTEEPPRSRRDWYPLNLAAAATAADTGDAFRELIVRLEERVAEAVELRTRLELTEQAESTLRAERDRLLEDLEHERERAERARERAEEARRVSEQLKQENQQAQEGAERLSLERQRAQEEAKQLREELEAERSKGFWRRLFGGS